MEEVEEVEEVVSGQREEVVSKRLTTHSTSALSRLLTTN